MICPRCQKNVATVQVTEVRHFVAKGHSENQIRLHHLCEVCAQDLNLPHMGMVPKTDIWKLLQIHKLKAQLARKSGPECKKCGMTLDELRRRGRVGCANDYEVFRKYLDELLERMHGSHTHVGRLPGLPEGEIERVQRVNDLRSALELAVRKEDYERAAELRDELNTLEAGQEA